ncbi:MAG: type II secretion system F family protein [Defluviitaleaceae bacterium]|nr:type II secretion system F family protein [Defluviitaleaceae bacterium]
MPKYKYTALDVDNKKVIGVIDARDEYEFRRLMRQQQLFPAKFTVVGEKGGRYRFKANEVADFCRELSSMLSSGITAVRAMEIIKERNHRPNIKKIYDKMHKDIQQGMELSVAMRSHGNAFPALLINMFASGETSGRLENVTERMAIHYEKEHRLNGKIKSAMRYPKILGAATVLVVVVIFVFVLPSFFEMLEDFELPWITRAVIAISDFMIYRFYIIIGAVVGTILLWKYLMSMPKFKLRFHKSLLQIPVIGKLLRTIYTARFARTLSSLYTSGVSMIQSLEITGSIIMNTYIESQFPQLVLDVRNGESLSESIRKVDGFDGKLASTILIGEESGRLDNMLIGTADSFEYEAEQAAGALVQLTEPAVIVVMGGVIMIVLLSVMLPMASLYEGFGI